MSSVRVHFLGTGDPFAPGGRLQSSILVESDGGRILLDCGATALVGLARAGIDPATIDAVLLTHLHGDHFGGLPFFVLEARLNPGGSAGLPPRRGPIRIAGPAGTEARLRRAIEAFGYDGIIAPLWDDGTLQFTVLEPSRGVTVGPATVTAYPVIHTPEAVALRVAIGGKTIAYSGDTAWTDTLLDASADADLFICLAYYFNPAATAMISYHALMQQRHRLTCKRLILTHVAADMLHHLAEVTEEVADDGLIVTL